MATSISNESSALIRREYIVNEINIQISTYEKYAKYFLEKAKNIRNFIKNQTSFEGSIKKVKGNHFYLVSELSELNEEAFMRVSLPPIIRLILEVNKKRKIHLMLTCGLNEFIDGVAVHRHIALWIDEVLKKASSEYWRKQISNAKGKCARREERMKKSIDKLICRYGRILIVRIDLFYSNRQLAASRISDDLQRLRRNMSRNKALSDGHLIGFVKMEFGIAKGPHAHLLLIYDGNVRWRDDVVGDIWGKYWADTITRGDGSFFNANRLSAKDRLSKHIGIPVELLAIGMHKISDSEKRRNLSALVGYIAKDDQRLVTNLDGASRSFRVFSSCSVK